MYGGRWNSKGVRMVYLGGSQAIAVLEAFVHFEPGIVPPDYAFFQVDVPDDSTETLDPASLPADWRAVPAPAMLQMMGDAWIASGRSLALRVPSAPVPGEENVLLNPSHPDFVRVRVAAPVDFAFDPRLRRGVPR